jgi:hypothetical protein
MYKLIKYIERELAVQGNYKSELLAKRAFSRFEGTCIVKFSDGSYDFFPLGYPIGKVVDGQFVKATNYKIVARAHQQSNGDIVWKSG